MSVDDGHALPVGQGDAHEVFARAFEQYIGEPPPVDHGQVWGGYKCECGAHHVRLWRDYQTFLDHQTLRCRSCALSHEGKGAGASLRGDQIGWSVPAVPTPDGETFWGYTSVPMAAVSWWRELPESPPKGPRAAKRAGCKARRRHRQSVAS